MMMTLALKELFAEQARQDHFQRMKVLLTELDVALGHSRNSDFEQTLQRSIEQLQDRGVLGAYAQSCMLLSFFAGGVPINARLDVESPQLLLVHAMKKALDAGVPHAAFQYLFESLTGLVCFDQPWAEVQAPINLLTLLSGLGACPAILQLDSNQFGPIDQNTPLGHSDTINYLRTDSGFRHGVFGQFTPLALLNQVCKTKLPISPWVISPNPWIERCELGREESGVFQAIQQIDLFDARQVHMKHRQHPLSFSATELNQFELSLQESEFFHDPVLCIESPLMLAQLDFQAGWVNGGTQAIAYQLDLDLRLQLLAGSFKWQGSLIHENVLVNVAFQTQYDTNLKWQFHDQKIPGQLPIGEPLWTIQKSIPLVVQVVSVVSAGKPLMTAFTPTVGDLFFTLEANIHPESHLLQLTLTLAHSDLVCNWQSVDSLKGWCIGNWPLAKAATVMCWDLQHG